MITTINFHLTKACNFKCKFCFANFKDITANEMHKEEQIQLLKILADCNMFRKINFAGGEPTLVPHITELIKYSKSLGFETSIVTNASRIDFEWVKNIAPYLDILAISVDSVNKSTNMNSGRNQFGNTISEDLLIEISNACRIFGVNLKINTVVSQFNMKETITPFINSVKPFRWKILQATRIEGQNDQNFDSIIVSAEDFSNYCKRNNENIHSEIKVIEESSDIIIGSYLIIDQLGRFCDDSNQKHNYSGKIMELGVIEALKQVNTNTEKYIARNGNYSMNKSEKLCSY